MKKIIRERLEESINVKKLILKDGHLLSLIEEIADSAKESLFYWYFYKREFNKYN